MKSKLFIPGFSLAEYRLIIPVAEHLQEKINAEKNYFISSYTNSKIPLANSTITLTNFMQYSSAEELIVKKFGSVIGSFQPTQIEVYNFGFLPTHTIFFKLANKSAVQTFSKKIKAKCAQYLNADNEHAPHFINEPYIPLACKLKADEFSNAIAEYTQRHFKGSFVAENMVLLKREPGNQRYEKVSSFLFNTATPPCLQTRLF